MENKIENKDTKKVITTLSYPKENILKAQELLNESFDCIRAERANRILMVLNILTHAIDEGEKEITN